jgi:hypothetical protein
VTHSAGAPLEPRAARADTPIMASSRLGAGLLTLAAVLALPATAAARDRNHDQIPDRWERAHHLSLRVNQAARDPDRDGLNNYNEWIDGTDPHRADSDGNGTPDGLEDSNGDGIENLYELASPSSGSRPAAAPPAPAPAAPAPPIATRTS